MLGPKWTWLESDIRSTPEDGLSVVRLASPDVKVLICRVLMRRFFQLVRV